MISFSSFESAARSTLVPLLMFDTEELNDSSLCSVSPAKLISGLAIEAFEDCTGVICYTSLSSSFIVLDNSKELSTLGYGPNPPIGTSCS